MCCAAGCLLRLTNPARSHRQSWHRLPLHPGRPPSRLSVPSGIASACCPSRAPARCRAHGLDSRPGMLSPLAILDWLPAGSDDGELATLGSVAFQHLASRAQGGDVWIPPLVNQVKLALAAPFTVRPVIVGGQLACHRK